MGLATAIIGSAVVGAGASAYGASQNRKAQRAANDASAEQARQANMDEMMRYWQSRGAAMGATYDELTAKPFLADGTTPNPDYDPNVSMFSADGSAKHSAVLPMYLSGLESSMGQNIATKYDALQEAYNPEEQMALLQGYREQLQPAVDGQIQTVQDLYSGAELAGRQEQLDKVNNARAQGMLMAAQRNAAAQDFTGRSGIVGNSGNAITNQLQALAQGYASAGEKTAASNMALYENDLAQRKNPNLVANTLTGAANASVAGLEQAYAPEKLASGALNQGGYQLGQGRMPEVNVGAITPVSRDNPFAHLSAGLNAGVAGYGLYNAFGKGGTKYSDPPGTTTTLHRPIP